MAKIPDYAKAEARQIIAKCVLLKKCYPAAYGYAVRKTVALARLSTSKYENDNGLYVLYANNSIRRMMQASPGGVQLIFIDNYEKANAELIQQNKLLDMALDIINYPQVKK